MMVVVVVTQCASQHEREWIRITKKKIKEDHCSDARKSVDSTRPCRAAS